MDVQSAVLSAIRAKTGDRAEPIGADSVLSEIGLDSLHIVQVVIDIEEQCGLELDDQGVSEVLQATSVGDLTDAFSMACLELSR